MKKKRLAFVFILIVLFNITYSSLIYAEEIDISGFRYDLERGDIFFQESPHLSTRLFPGPIDHAGIYNGSGKTIDAISPKVEGNPMYLYQHNELRGIGRVTSATVEQRNAVADYNDNEIGEEYSLWPFRHNFWPPFSENAKWYCSELISASYSEQGIDLDEGLFEFSTIEQLWTTPSEIYQSDDVEILTPTINHPNTVHGFVFEFDSWTAELDVDDLDGMILEIELPWSVSSTLNDLDLVVTDPHGKEYDKNSEEEVFEFSGPWPERMKFTSPMDGTWTVTVEGGLFLMDTDLLYLQNFQDFKIKTRTKPGPDAANKTGGINFTNAQLNYVSTCNPSEGLEVVMKAEEADSGDTIINITNTTIDATDAFLTGLVIPDHKMWVTMDTVPGSGFAGRVGDVSRVDPKLAQTKAGQIMFDADIQLKFDTFGQSQSLVESLVNNWVNTVSGDPDKVPGFYARVWISPETLTANGTDCKIFLTNSTLTVESNVDSVWIDGGGYETELAQFKTDLENGLASIAQTAAEKINTHDVYADLRNVYASIALAQWYKENNKDQGVFSDLIDSYDISGLEQPFDQAYYEAQAWQHLWTFYHNNDYWYRLYGGVEMTDLNTNVEEQMSARSELQVSNASITSYHQDGNEYYYSSAIPSLAANIEPVVVGFSNLTPIPGDTINISVAVENTGDKNASAYTIFFTSTFENEDGSQVTEQIGEINTTGLNTDEIVIESLLWTIPTGKIGLYNVTATVDHYNELNESNTLDNTESSQILVYTNDPTATIVSPNTNTYACGITTLSGRGSDFQDGDLANSSLNWISSINGNLGEGTQVSYNLTIGTHDIVLNVTDSEGYSSTDRITLHVVACNDPVPSISSPIANMTYAEGETIFFMGEALDEEDGVVPDSSLNWSSHLDGLIGNGAETISKILSVGNHLISFTAIDLTGLIGTKTINITVEEGTPIVTIDSPQDNHRFTHKDIKNFTATAIDPQDGNVSLDIVWTSSIDGTIGSGAAISTNISIGDHLITATIIDSHGLTNSSEISVSILAPQYPEVSIITPRNTQQFTHGDNFTLLGEWSDFEDQSIPDASIVWSSNKDGVIGTGTTFIENNISVGSHNITLSINDSDGLTSAAQVEITINPAAPVPVITSPTHGTVFAEIEPVVLQGTVTDFEDGQLTGSSVNWTSSKDGYLGSGTFLNVSSLSQGTHLITFEGTDSSGLVGTNSLNIIVVGISQNLIDRFADFTSAKNLTFVTLENKTAIVSISKWSNVSYGAINVRGYSP